MIWCNRCATCCELKLPPIKSRTSSNLLTTCRKARWERFSGQLSFTEQVTAVDGRALEHNDFISLRVAGLNLEHLYFTVQLFCCSVTVDSRPIPFSALREC